MSASETKWVRLGDYIVQQDERNFFEKYQLSDVRGISIEKKLIFTKADMKDVSLKPYKLLKPNSFCYVTVTSRNGGKISLAMNETSNTFIVSSSYITFCCKDETILLPGYLFLLLSRPEFDRYSRFNSWGSARETFDWEEFCRVDIPLPSIEVQRELVETYNGLKVLAEQNEVLVASLSKMCEALVIESGKKYSRVSLGEYINQVDERNTFGKYTLDDVRGISIEKELIYTKADMKGVSLSPYKLLKPRNFCYVSVTSRNGGKISLAINNMAQTFIVSSSYINFDCKNYSQLLPEYLFLLLSRSEFDRYSRFNSWGSARETFDWSELCRAKIPLPPIEAQQSIVNLYHCMEEAKGVAAIAREKLKTICPALVLKGANA